MAVAPLNKFLTIAVPVAPGEQTIYKAPVGTSAIVLYAQVSNVGIGASYPTVTFSHRRTSVASRTVGNERNNRIVKDAEIPPNDALILVDGRLVLERTAIVADSIVLSGVQTGIGTIMNVLYDGITGITTIRTLDPHGFSLNDEITMAGIAFTCTGTYGLTTSIFPTPQASFKIDEVLNANTFITDVGIVNDLPHVYRPAFHRFVRSDVGSISVTGGVLGPFTPTNAGYDPESGILELTIPSHGLTSPTTHKATTGTVYDPLSGIMTVTVDGTPSPALQNGEFVKFNNNSLLFECTYGGATGSDKQKSYPRESDPAGGNFLPISNESGSTFEVGVGTGKGNYDHDFVTGQDATNNAIVFGGNYAHTFVSASSGAVRNSSTGPSYTTFNVDGATYNAGNGVLVLTLNSTGGLSASDEVDIKINSLLFSCAMDSHATNHSYPRATDPVMVDATTYPNTNGDSDWSRKIPCTVDSVAKTITLNVGSSIISQATPSAATYNGQTGELVLTLPEGYNINRPQPSNLTISNADFTPEIGIMTCTVASHGLHTGDRIRIADSSLKFKCDLDPSGPAHAYPRPYDPDSKKWLHVTYVGPNQFSVNVTPSSNTSDHNFDSADPSSVEVASDSIKLVNGSIVFTCDKDNYASKHYYPRSTDPYYNTSISIGSTTATSISLFVGKSIVNQPHTFVSGTTDGIKRAMSTINIANESLTFKCSQDNYATEHKYPRPSDPVYGDTLGVDVVGVNTISTYVGVSTAGGLVGPLQMEFICSILENSTV